MAGHAIVENTSVAKNCPGKSRCIEMTDRTILIGGIGRYVVSGLARDDYVVVTGRAIVGDTGMIIGAGGKSAGGMANLAIQSGRHMIGRFTARRNPVTGIAACGQDGRICMVNTESRRETVSIMAAAAVGGGYQVRGYCGRLGRCVDAIAIIVACFTG